MTLDETRQLGIEFERRVQTMIPETEYVSKLDTETIYSYLNLYLDKYIHDIYKSLDSVPTPSKIDAYLETVLQPLIVNTKMAVDSTERGPFQVELPDDFGLYIESKTHVDKSYRKGATGDGVLPNTLISKTAAAQLITRPHDDWRIVRSPIAYLDAANGVKVLVVYCDRYTAPTDIAVSYYKTPAYMSLFDKKPCELHVDMFDDLVSGAVDLYVQYAAGAEARRRQMNELARRNRKEDSDDRN